MTVPRPSNALTLSERLQRVEPDFFEAYDAGEEALERFSFTFQELLEDISSEPQLDVKTAMLANTVATRITHISEGLHRLQVQTDQLTEDAVKQYDVIASEYTSHAHPVDSRNKQFEACYRWLIKNLHNPYPSAKTKQAIADSSSAPLVNVDNWFLRARPRIGWNKVRKERFENNTPRMLAAAHQYFIEDKSSPHARPGPSSQPIRKPLSESLNLAFSEIEMKAKHMYKDRYHTSEEMIAAASQSKCRASHPYKDARVSRSKSRRPSTTGTSTTYRSSRSPSVTDSTTAPSTKRKRAPENAGTELDKRSKNATSIPVVLSRSSSPQAAEEEWFWAMPEEPVIIMEPTPVTRKRRLSAADAEGRPKRPKGLPLAPRANIVSDPLPKSASMQDLRVPSVSELFSQAQTQNILRAPTGGVNSSLPTPAIQYIPETNDLLQDLLACVEKSAIMPEYQLSPSADGADIFNTVIDATFGQMPSSNAFDNQDIDWNSLIQEWSSEGVGAAPTATSASVDGGLDDLMAFFKDGSASQPLGIQPMAAPALDTATLAFPPALMSMADPSSQITSCVGMGNMQASMGLFNGPSSSSFSLDDFSAETLSGFSFNQDLTEPSIASNGDGLEHYREPWTFQPQPSLGTAMVSMDQVKDALPLEHVRRLQELEQQALRIEQEKQELLKAAANQQPYVTTTMPTLF